MKNKIFLTSSALTMLFAAAVVLHIPSSAYAGCGDFTWNGAIQMYVLTTCAAGGGGGGGGYFPIEDFPVGKRAFGGPFNSNGRGQVVSASQKARVVNSEEARRNRCVNRCEANYAQLIDACLPNDTIHNIEDFNQCHFVYGFERDSCIGACP